MRGQHLASLAALLIVVGLLPLPAIAAAPAAPAAASSELAAARADQCSPSAMARLSAAVEAKRTAWSQSLTPNAYSDFKAARDQFAARRSACSQAFSDGTAVSLDSTDGLRYGPSATSDAPHFVPTTGIAVDIRSTSDEVIAGLDLVYAVTVTTGSSDGADSTDVEVEVDLPVASGPAYVADTGGCTFATPTLTCDLGTIARGGASRSFLVTMSTPPHLYFDGVFSLVATASATRTEAEGITADNTDSASTVVTEQADVHAFALIFPATPVPGELFQYTILAENRGPSVARNVQMRDTIFAGPADATDAPLSIQSCAFSVSQGGGAITQFTCTTGNVVGTQFGTDAATFRTNRVDPMGWLVDPINEPGLMSEGRLRGAFRLMLNRELTTASMLTISSETPDPDASNNVATITTESESAADLALTKSATGEEQQVNQPGLIFNNAIFGQAFPTAPNYFVSTRVTAGRRIQYAITVTNPGTTLAENVVLTDRLPAGVRHYQGSLVVTNGGTCTMGTPGDPSDPLVCALGAIRPVSGTFDEDIPTSKVVTFEVVVDADVAAGTVLTNDATVTSDGLELDNSDNLASVQRTVLAAADQLALKASTGQNLVLVAGRYVFQDLPNQVTAGYVLRSSITVQNNGPSDAQHVTVLDQLPDVLINGVMPLTFIRAENADCRPDAVHARDIYCALGTMAAGERRTFDIYTQVHEEVPDGQLVQNCATVLSGSSNTVPPGAPPTPPTGGPTGTLTWDPLFTNNHSCTFVTVNAAPAAQGLAIDKSGPAMAEVGEEITYVLTVTNAGPGSANNVVVTDFLPGELRNVVVTPSQGACLTGVPGDSSRPLICNLGNLAAGGTATIDIDAQIKPTLAGNITVFNDVQVTTTSADANNADNIDSVSMWVIPYYQPDAWIRKGTKAFVGQDIYNTDGTDQARTGKAYRGGTITFGIQIQNDGAADCFTVEATGAATTMYNVRYYRGGTEITAAVVAGTYTTPVLAPGAKFLITAKVKVKQSATVGSSVTRLVTITSVENPAKQDAVTFTGSRK